MINRDQWLAAVKEAANAPLPESDAASIRELAELFGVNKTTADRRVKLLVKTGKAERTTKLVRTETGLIVRVSAYRLKDLPKPSRKRS